jgi:hypothetical protein
MALTQKQQPFLYTALSDRTIKKIYEAFKECKTKSTLNKIRVNYGLTSMQWFRWLVIGLLLRRREFENGPINATIVADKGN